EPIKSSDLTSIYALYDSALDVVQCPTYRWNFEVSDELLPLLDKGFLARRAVININRVTAEWIGHPSPAALLVGERFGTWHQASAPVTFVPYKATSGYFLMQELLHAGLTNVAICNAWRSDGEPERVKELWRALGVPRVVALGREA